jgi:hypothetical protein
MGYDKARWRKEQAVRLSVTYPAMTDAEIAEQVGLTPAGLATMKAQPEWKQLWLQFTTKVLGDIDEDLANDQKALRERHKRQVPMALSNMYDLMMSRDEKIKLAASKDVLARDGNFAEVSRIGMPTEEQGGFMSKTDQDVANAIVGVMTPKGNTP